MQARSRLRTVDEYIDRAGRICQRLFERVCQAYTQKGGVNMALRMFF